MYEPLNSETFIYGKYSAHVGTGWLVRLPTIHSFRHACSSPNFWSGTWPSAPSGEQPLPEVVARGTDKRNGRIYDLIAAYDGSSAKVGRIVADSTWHHYFNVNLRGFPPGGSVISQLNQYYVNLAVWLSPPAKRAQISCWQRWKLVHNPNVLMTYPNGPMALGRVAAAVLRKSGGPCLIQDVLEPAQNAIARLGAPQPPPELMLGGVIEAYLDAFRRADAGDTTAHDADVDELVRRGIRAAYTDYTQRLEKATEEATQAQALIERHLTTDD